MTSMWGESHDKKATDFYNLVDGIEQKYLDLFKDEINPKTGKIPDNLSRHFLFEHDIYKTRLAFNKDSYVPKFIQDEVTSAFRVVFKAM